MRSQISEFLRPFQAGAPINVFLLTYKSYTRLLRAYGLAYVSTTAPRLLNLLLILYKNKSARGSTLSSTTVTCCDTIDGNANYAKMPANSLQIYSVLVGSFPIRRLPTFCAALVGGYTFLQWPLRLLFDYASIPRRDKRVLSRRFSDSNQAASRFLAALISAWFSLEILNKRALAEVDWKDSKQAAQHQPTGLTLQNATILDSKVSLTSPLVSAGKTVDLTLLAFTRALDSLVVNLYRRSYPSFANTAPASSTFLAISQYADTFIFALSSGTVMWAWFYLPDRLPRAYNKWISEAARVDPRLIDVLRKAHAGEFIYGEDTGQAHILQSMCSDYGWPLAWGDPIKTTPIPCEIVHMGTGPSCHWHAAVRFSRAFRFALATYLPLQLLVKARNPSFMAFRRACEEAVRSSAFLGAFVGLFYYGVCLSRTRLGPSIFSRETITPMMWDSGLCVGAGCVLCGWSTLIEAEKRRMELALFIAPRALATLLPRDYDAKVGFFLYFEEQWTEAD
ncbi:MAG: hypothetical protein ASARMPRED_002204 [Alectoria sarmentosa]|nr:MAG: hypothetical protein ASARMPRED_002204 [Alectoria sarmentosa]